MQTMQPLTKGGTWKMASSKITLMGCSSFFATRNDDLFKYLSLPEGLSKDTLTDNILLKGAEFEVAYSDPFLLQNAIGIWSNVNQATFVRWVDALAIEYAPLENYDRHEDWTDEGNASSTSNGTSSTSNEQSAENTKSAFDASTYQPNEKDVINSGTESEATDNTENESLSTHSGRIHGNIGVTTSQQMLQAELDLGYWNVYERITDLFLREFSIPVYV